MTWSRSHVAINSALDKLRALDVEDDLGREELQSIRDELESLLRTCLRFLNDELTTYEVRERLMVQAMHDDLVEREAWAALENSRLRTIDGVPKRSVDRGDEATTDSLSDVVARVFAATRTVENALGSVCRDVVDETEGCRDAWLRTASEE